MRAPLPIEIRSLSFDYAVWGLHPGTDDTFLVIESRDEENKKVHLHRMQLAATEAEVMPIQLHWQEKMVAIDEEALFSIRYESQNDPSNHRFNAIDLETGSRKEVSTLPAPTAHGVFPSLYEVESKNHQVVADFLSVELPLSCEYLEIGDNIIISYYLRSENGFDRFLLLLQEGAKVWKVVQDPAMKGFAVGAFFVLNNKLIFIRDRNEVCVYNL